jgi:hypothetical protein
MNFTKTALAFGSAIGVQELLKSVQRVSLDHVLGVVGLKQRPSTIAQLLPAAALITVSAAVGASVALLLAPSSGTKLRARLSDGIDEATNKLSDSIGQYETSRAQRHSIS